MMKKNNYLKPETIFLSIETISLMAASASTLVEKKKPVKKEDN